MDVLGEAGFDAEDNDSRENTLAAHRRNNSIISPKQNKYIILNEVQKKRGSVIIASPAQQRNQPNQQIMVRPESPYVQQA
jgi:ABC-type uncharacterized transport system auxiliary subunit